MNNFMSNGIANVRLDPLKINFLLADVPFKLVEGTISSIKLVFGGMKKLDVVIDKINVVLYVDDHSQYQHSLRNRSTFEVDIHSLARLPTIMIVVLAKRSQMGPFLTALSRRVRLE